MKKFLTTQRLLLAILLIASFFRLWQLPNVPPSVSMDESSIGWNAYSVLKTGGDEFGEFPLISQRGYDDWRRSTYLLLTLPFIAVFDLSTLAIRLPAALLSIVTVWASYYIVRNLFHKRSPFVEHVALGSTLLLAISPWHIYISRLGHESNACLSFFIVGMMFFLQSMRQKTWVRLFIAGIFFTLSLISYYSGQAFIPLIGMLLLAVFSKHIFSLVTTNKKSLVAFTVLAVFIVSALWSVFSPQALIRFKGTSTLTPEAHGERFAEQVRQRNQAAENNDIIGMIRYHHRLFPVYVFMEGYVSHFKPSWLFSNNGTDSFKAPYNGLLYQWELPFILIGILTLLRRKELDNRGKLVLFLWFLLAPLPAALATQAPHAMRVYNILPTWQIFTALGIITVINFNYLRTISTLGIGALLLFSGYTFYQNYFIVFPLTQSQAFHYAMGQIMPYVLTHQGSYDKVVFSNQKNLYQSYMVFLYYSSYNPNLYRQQGGTISGGYNETHQFGKYEFRPINWDQEKSGNALFIGNPEEMTKAQPLTIGQFKDGTIGVIVAHKP